MVQTTRRMKYQLLSLIFALIISSCIAQKEVTNELPKASFTTEEAKVHQIIIDLFDGMREGDSAKVHRTFDDRVMMWTSYTNKKGKAILEQGELQKFLDAVGTPHDDVWNEKIRNTKIEIDGNLAQAWTEYGFFVGEKFSHCGVDAFLFSKIDGHWKIISLADTRQRKGCDWE